MKMIRNNGGQDVPVPSIDDIYNQSTEYSAKRLAINMSAPNAFHQLNRCTNDMVNRRRQGDPHAASLRDFAETLLFLLAAYKDMHGKDINIDHLLYAAGVKIKNIDRKPPSKS